METNPRIDVGHIIDDVMSRYANKENESYNSCRYVGEEERDIHDEMFMELQNNGVHCQVDLTEAFDFAAGTIYVLSIAWCDKIYGLHLRTYVLEDI